MEFSVEHALQRAVTAHKEGKLQDAERLYRAILQYQPTHPDANHNLGLIAVSANQVEEALSLFKIALDVNPKFEQFWMSYVDALVQNQQLNDAKRAIKKAKRMGSIRRNFKHYSLNQKEWPIPDHHLRNSLVAFWICIRMDNLLTPKDSRI